MKASKVILFFGLFLIFIVNQSRCQVIDKANQRYGDLAYYEAIPKFEQVLQKDSSNVDAWAKLGDCYRLINEHVKAERCYAQVVRTPGTAPIYKLYYALALMSNRKYAESKKWFEAYQEADPGDSRAPEFAETVSHIDQFYIDTAFYSVQRLSINSEESDFSPVLYKEGLVFASSRANPGMVKRVHSWTGKNFLSMYYVKGKEGKFEKADLFAKDIQTKYNNGPVCFNKNQDEMYFTRNNIEEGKIKASKKNVVLQKIFSATLKNGEWAEVKSFLYNSDQYNCEHPYLSSDGSKLYFASDMPGSIGGQDLWVCARQGNSWSVPVNLGPGINTKGNELFPNISEDSILYFSSNGRSGLGGLDIFSVKITPAGFGKVRNMLAPINSPDDDFGYWLDTKSRSGYLSSNRDQQGENDDIFSVHKNTLNFDGLVVDAGTGIPLDSAFIEVIATGKTTQNDTTEKDGHFTANILPSDDYVVIVHREKYISDTLHLRHEDLITSNGNMFVKVELVRQQLHIAIEGRIFHEGSSLAIAGSKVRLINLTTNDTLTEITDLSGSYSFRDLKPEMNYRILAELDTCASNSAERSTVGLLNDSTLRADIGLYCARENIILRNIYYNLDKFNIRPDAAAELDKLVVVLNKYPGMKIELSSHTDCRATAAYNMRLSQNRAKAAVDYLVKKGIGRSRLTAKGYGETKLINACECEGKHIVPCTETEHQLNRRTEFRILVIR